MCVLSTNLDTCLSYIPTETNHKIHVRLEFNFTSNLKCRPVKRKYKVHKKRFVY